MKYLLDTVAISESGKSSKNPAYDDFILGTAPDSKFISVVSIAELRFGLTLLPEGKRKEAIKAWIGTVDQEYAGRVLGVDEQLAGNWGDLRAEMKKRGYTLSYNDLLIAATALHYDLTVVTRNVKDFAPTGCKLLNPWEQRL